MRKNLTLAAAAACAFVAVPATAASVVVDAFGNSSSGGVGAATGVTLTAGDNFTVTAALSDLWSAGALPRWSNANGLTGDLFATGSDESGQSVGTLIGTNFGTNTQDGFSAPFGALVGQIGSTYHLLGTNFSGPAWASGSLKLYYWDSNFGDNTGSVLATIAGVPEPATWGLMVLGVGLVGASMRRRARIASRSVACKIA